MIIETLIFLLAVHWVADYPLQGDFLANAKQKGPLRVYHLAAHSGIHAGGVMLVTGSAFLALCEFVAHCCIDELKTRNKISFATDQALHIGCKIVWLGALYYAA